MLDIDPVYMANLKAKIDANELKRLDPRLAETKIDPDKDVPEQPMLLSMGKDWSGRANCILGEGDYSVVTGVAKTRKTFFKSMLIASYIAGDESTRLTPFRTHRTHDKMILDIDTEQNEFHTQRAYKRIEHMVGSRYKNYHAYHWKLEEPAEKIRLLENLVDVHGSKIGLIVLDGFIDFVQDFNNERECFNFQHKIMEWCHKYKIHVLGVLHKNPDGSKMIGHLGSIMERKAATIIELSKQPGSLTSLVTHERARDMEFEPFEMEINQGLPYKI